MEIFTYVEHIENITCMKNSRVTLMRTALRPILVAVSIRALCGRQFINCVFQAIILTININDLYIMAIISIDSPDQMNIYCQENCDNYIRGRETAYPGR